MVASMGKTHNRQQRSKIGSLFLACRKLDELDTVTMRTRRDVGNRQANVGLVPPHIIHQPDQRAMAVPRNLHRAAATELVIEYLQRERAITVKKIAIAQPSLMTFI